MRKKMAIKRDPPQEMSNYEDSDEDGSIEDEQPTKEELENLEQKIAANTKELANISNALAQSMLISVLMAANCPPNSEILEKINLSNEAIVACVEEVAKIGAILNYIKEELQQFK